jgi:beta-ureidopropionase
LIQMSLKAPTNKSPADIAKAMLDAHVPLIEKAGTAGVQILCFQEVFNQPYFCPSQDAKWYGAAERIPDGPTVRRMQEFAKKYRMVLVVPIYEEAMTGVYYNSAAVIDADGSYLGKYRKTHIPQVAGFWEKFFFKPGASEYPVFSTAYCKLGVYICYDRHFPEGWRALALNGAEYRIYRQSIRNRCRAIGISVEAGAARCCGRQRHLHRGYQSRRHRSSLEHRRILRAKLFC